MNEQDYITALSRQENPFRVPDGYFDHLADQVLAALPAEEKPTARQVWMKRWRPVLYAAACTCFALFTATLYFLPGSHSNAAQQAQVEAVQKNVVDSYVDDAADYAMVDNQDIYACLTSE